MDTGFTRERAANHDDIVKTMCGELILLGYDCNETMRGSVVGDLIVEVGGFNYLLEVKTMPLNRQRWSLSLESLNASYRQIRPVLFAMVGHTDTWIALPQQLRIVSGPHRATGNGSNCNFVLVVVDFGATTFKDFFLQK